MNRFGPRSFTLKLAGAAMLWALHAVASAGEFDRELEFSIPPQSLASAVMHFAEQSSIQVVTSSAELERFRSRGLSGRYNVRAALTELLTGTGLTFREVGSGTVSIAKREPQRDETAASPAGTPIRLAQAEGTPSSDAANASQDAVTGVVEDVVVTAQRKFRPETSSAASKLELPLIETPQALTVLSSEFLNIARLNDTAGVIAYAPGVELQGMGDGTQANINARGFAINRERSFRINGLSADSEIDLDYYAMDRVEIVRGPASSLYGETDYGATLNRVLKRPNGRRAFGASAELGSYDFRRLQADFQTPLGDSPVSVRAVAAVQDSETFIDATEDDRILFAPSLSIDLDRTQLLLQGYYQKLEGATSDGFPLINTGALDDRGLPVYELPTQPRERNYAADVFEIDSENQFVYGQADHAFNDTTRLSFKTGYSRIKMANVSGVYFNADAAGNSVISPFREDKTKEDLSVDLALEKSLTMGGREQRFVVSADWRMNQLWSPRLAVYPSMPVNIFEDGPFVGYPDPMPVVGEFRSTRQYFSGVSTMAYLKPAERLSVLLGLRYSRIDTNVRNYANAGRVDVTIDGASDNQLVPRAALVYSLADQHKAYLSYSEGIIFNQTSLRVDGTPVNPETGVQYELGFKGELADRRVMYGASLFRIERKDSAQRIPDRPTDLPPAFENVGEQFHQGLELELVGEPVPGLNLVASYAYLDVDINEAVNPLAVGQTPSGSPVHSYSFFTTYEILHGPLRSLTFGGGVVARSEREADSVGSFALPGYERVDLRMSYNVTDAMLLELNAQNLLNERIYTSQYGAANFGIAYGYPRTYAARLSYRW
jgi:TonB-dependent siderophore receptor